MMSLYRIFKIQRESLGVTEKGERAAGTKKCLLFKQCHWQCSVAIQSHQENFTDQDLGTYIVK